MAKARSKPPEDSTAVATDTSEEIAGKPEDPTPVPQPSPRPVLNTEADLRAGLSDLLDLSRSLGCDNVTRSLRDLVDPEDKGEPISISEAARILGKHRSTIGRWAQEGLIPAFRLPNKTFGCWSRDVEKLLSIFQP